MWATTLILPEEFKAFIDQGGECEEQVYFLVLGVYITDDESSSVDVDSLKKALSGFNIIGGVYFEETHEIMSYIRREPPVIETSPL